jgi:excinuclease UvrABC nuclease subunit
MVMVLSGCVDVSEVLECGVYVLLHRGEVVYIGQAKEMLKRVYTHAHFRGRLKPANFRSSKYPQRGFQFDEVQVRPCAVGELDDLEREMIQQHQPKHNTRLKPGAPMPEAIRQMINEMKSPAPEMIEPSGFNRRGL